MSNTEEFVNLLHREIEQFIDEGYEKLDQLEYEKQEIGLIMHGQSDYYYQYPDEYEKDKKICELENEVKRLEHRLSNCIEPKFKPHNDLFVIVGYKDEPKTVEQYYIDEIVVRGNGTLVEYRDIEKNAIIGQNNTLFATREEAERYLEELKNG